MKPFASSDDHALAVSPYSPSLFFTRSLGESTPTVWKQYGRSSSVTSPVTLRCELSSIASMSGMTGSRY